VRCAWGSGRCLLRIVPLLLLVGILGSAAGCASTESTAESPSRNPSPVASSSPAAPAAGSAAELYAALVRAIRAAKPSTSPDALCAYVVAATKAPRVIVVSPYDSKAVEDYGSIVAAQAVDGSLAMDLLGLAHDSKGKPYRGRTQIPTFGSPYFFAGHAAKVDGRAGYVLVASPAQ